MSLYQVADGSRAPIRVHDAYDYHEGGCEECTHFTRSLPDCSCVAGYKEDTPVGAECILDDLPNTCIKEVKILSVGSQKTGNGLEMHLNNVSLGTFTQGISVVVLTDDMTAKESSSTFDNLDDSFNP